MIPLSQSKKLINSDTAAALLALNRLRNEFAHKLNYEVTPSVLDDFVKRLRGVIREMYDESIPEMDVPTQSPYRERQLLRLALCAISSDLQGEAFPID